MDLLVSTMVFLMDGLGQLKLLCCNYRTDECFGTMSREKIIMCCCVTDKKKNKPCETATTLDERSENSRMIDENSLKAENRVSHALLERDSKSMNSRGDILNLTHS